MVENSQVSEHMDVSIVMPTKNAGSLLDKVLSAVFSQKTDYKYEVICVDSGSSDNTLDIIAKYPVKLYKIPASEFGHGKTRVYGASKGTGDFIVFITQDALPANDTWLQNFIDAMKMDPGIVGGFGIHYPYPDCNIIDKRDLKKHFEGFGTENTVFFLEDKARYETDEVYRHYLAFFSDNNSCVRRDIFEKYPYPDVDFAEDQIWARKMIEMGYKKVYCPFAPVYHSHNYDLHSYLGRYYDENKGLYEIHQYIGVKHWYYVLPGIIRHTLMDRAYFKTLGLTKEEYKDALRYSTRRNYARYLGAYLGGNYHKYSDKKKMRMDKRYSQQYEQRSK